MVRLLISQTWIGNYFFIFLMRKRKVTTFKILEFDTKVADIWWWIEELLEIATKKLFTSIVGGTFASKPLFHSVTSNRSIIVYWLHTKIPKSEFRKLKFRKLEFRRNSESQISKTPPNQLFVRKFEGASYKRRLRIFSSSKKAWAGFDFF